MEQMNPGPLAPTRLTNEDIADLYNRTPIGAKVIVFGTRQTGDQDDHRRMVRR